MPGRPLRVLHLIAGLGPGGAESMLCNLMEHRSPGCPEHVLVTVAREQLPAYLERAERACSSVHHLRMAALLKPAVLREILRIVRLEKPDVIQTWMHKADLAGAIVGRMAGVPVVWGIHSLDLFQHEGQSPWSIRGLKLALGVAAKLLPAAIASCARGAIDTHAAMGYPRKKMRWIPNGIDTARFQPSAEAGAALRASLGIPADALVVGFVGRSHPVKDVPTFLRAAARVQQTRPGVHFICCGSGIDAPSPAVEAVLSTLPHREHVHLLPGRPDIQQVFPAFDIMALTSASEAFPMVLIEAMACGIPCASTDVGDAAWIIQRPASMAPAGDDAAVAAAWESLLSLPAAERAAMGRAARASVVSQYSLQACAEAYAALYEEVCARPSPAPLPVHQLS